MYSFSALLMLALINTIKCSIVSQSSISTCEAGNDNEPNSRNGNTCDKKIIVSMVLSGNRQGDTESLYANIDRVYQEGETELSTLKQPFRIEISKTNVVASYRVNYLGSANAKPNEVWFQKRYCRDDWFAPDHELACGKQYGSDGEPVWDSQGFCCRCNDHNQRFNFRGGHTCYGSLLSGPYQFGSAHCMEYHDLWYNIFGIDAPFMQYNITIKIYQFNGVDESFKANWTLVSQFSLNPSKTIGRSSNGRVVAEIQGNLLGAFGPVDLSYKYLLVPSIAFWKNETLPIQYTNGPSDWLLVDRHMVDFTGLECSKIGVSYSAFKRQQGRCYRRAQSCFRSQPLDLWYSDKELQRQNLTTRYLLSGIGKIDESVNSNNNSFIVKLIYEDLHNTFITFRIDASNILFVYNVGKARIVTTYATDFQSLSGRGMIVVEVENTGDISSQFFVSILNCGSGVHTVAARSVSLDPGQSTEVTFTVQSYVARGTHYVCEVQLYDSDYNIIQTATVDFQTNSTCFCFGSCGCTCDNDNGTVRCPEPPPVVIDTVDLSVRIFLFILETIGLHGIVGIVGGMLIIFGFIKLSFGKIIFCRMTKAQKFAKELKKQGVVSAKGIAFNSEDNVTQTSIGPILVKCSGECRGAIAAKQRYKRKLRRLKELGKKPNRLDDWRNYSYSCTCQSELTDIKFMEIIKAVFFFYYCVVLPCVWVGRKCVWAILRDTVKQKNKAKEQVLKKAIKKGKLSKYHFDAVEEQTAELEKELRDNTKHQDASKEKKSSIQNNSNVNNSISNEKGKKLKRTVDVSSEKHIKPENDDKSSIQKKSNLNDTISNEKGKKSKRTVDVSSEKHIKPENDDKSNQKKLQLLNKMKQEAYLLEDMKKARKQQEKQQMNAKLARELLEKPQRQLPAARQDRLPYKSDGIYSQSKKFREKPATPKSKPKTARPKISRPAKPRSKPPVPSKPGKPPIPSKPKMGSKPPIPSKPKMGSKPPIPPKPKMGSKPPAPSNFRMGGKPSPKPQKPLVPPRPRISGKPSASHKPKIGGKPPVPPRPRMRISQHKSQHHKSENYQKGENDEGEHKNRDPEKSHNDHNTKEHNKDHHNEHHEKDNEQHHRHSDHHEESHEKHHEDSDHHHEETHEKHHEDSDHHHEETHEKHHEDSDHHHEEPHEKHHEDSDHHHEEPQEKHHEDSDHHHEEPHEEHLQHHENSDHHEEHHEDDEDHLEHHKDSDHHEKHHEDSEDHLEHHGDSDHHEKHHEDSEDHLEHHGDSDHHEKHHEDSEDHLEHHGDSDHHEEHHEDSEDHLEHHGDSDHHEEHHEDSEEHHGDSDHHEKHHEDSEDHLEHHGDSDHHEEHHEDSEDHLEHHGDSDHHEEHHEDSEEHHGDSDHHEEHHEDSEDHLEHHGDSDHHKEDSEDHLEHHGDSDHHDHEDSDYHHDEIHDSEQSNNIESEDHDDHNEPEDHDDHTDHDDHIESEDYDDHDNHTESEDHDDHIESEDRDGHTDHDDHTESEDHDDHTDHDNHTESEDHDDHSQSEDHDDHTESEDHDDHTDHDNHTESEDHDNHSQSEDHDDHTDHDNHTESEDHDNHSQSEDHDDHGHHDDSDHHSHHNDSDHHSHHDDSDHHSHHNDSDHHSYHDYSDHHSEPDHHDDYSDHYDYHSDD